MGVVELAGDEPAVVPPLGQPVRRGAANTCQCARQPGYIVDPQRRLL